PFHLKQLLLSLPLHFTILIISPSLLSFLTPLLPIFFPKPFLYQTDPYLQLPLLPQLHLTTLTLFQPGILLPVLGLLL
ncbi:MnhB domain-containing protein, partial [Staphylococcus saprophyticus]|uniref:MnhB domain-containing protein n=1 Tax=Staphylococcus saprophyticus TaxID=29385 RepID=UPI003704765C